MTYAVVVGEPSQKPHITIPGSICSQSLAKGENQWGREPRKPASDHNLLAVVSVCKLSSQEQGQRRKEIRHGIQYPDLHWICSQRLSHVNRQQVGVEAISERAYHVAGENQFQVSAEHCQAPRVVRQIAPRFLLFFHRNVTISRKSLLSSSVNNV